MDTPIWALVFFVWITRGFPSPPAEIQVPRFRILGLADVVPLSQPTGLAVTTEKRLLHQQGDPDSLFSLGSGGPSGKLRLIGAVEVNEVLLRAMAPDLSVDPSDTRSRAPGDYRALDAAGRPYQLRLGARLVW